MARKNRSGVVFVTKGLGRGLRDRLRKVFENPCSCYWTDELSAFEKTSIETLVLIARLRDITPELVKSIRTVAPSGRWRYLVFLEKRPVQALGAGIPCLGVRRPDQLHVVGDISARERIELMVRLMGVLFDAINEDQILDAWTESDEIVLVSPDLKRLHIPFRRLRSIRQFRKLSKRTLANFRVDVDGSYLHWPEIDEAMGWTELEMLVNPYLRMRLEQRAREFNVRYGRAIREVRRRHGLTQSGIDGLTERHLRRIEKGEQRATLPALNALAGAHGLSTNAYMNLLSEALAFIEVPAS